MSSNMVVTRTRSATKRKGEEEAEGAKNKKKSKVAVKEHGRKKRTQKKNRGDESKATMDVPLCDGEDTKRAHPGGFQRAIYSGKAGLRDMVGDIQYPSPTFDSSLPKEVLAEQEESAILSNIALRTARPGGQDPRPLVIMVDLASVRLWKSDEHEGNQLFFGTSVILLFLFLSCHFRS